MSDRDLPNLERGRSVADACKDATTIAIAVSGDTRDGISTRNEPPADLAQHCGPDTPVLDWH